jgi:hypothetical protein
MHFGKINTVKEQNPIDCNADSWCAAIARQSPTKTVLACSPSKRDRHTQGKGLIEGCDRYPDGGGKAIALEKSFNKSQHSIYCAIETYYRSLRITIKLARRRQANNSKFILLF